MKRKIAALGILLTALSAKAHAEGAFEAYLPASVLESMATFKEAAFNAADQHGQAPRPQTGQGCERSEHSSWPLTWRGRGVSFASRDGTANRRHRGRWSVQWPAWLVKRT